MTSIRYVSSTVTLATTLVATWLMLGTGAAVAQTAAAKAAAPAKKEATKPAVKKQAIASSASHTNLKSAAKNVAAGMEAAEAAMTPAELAIAERVQVGTLPCELGASVTLAADPKMPGYFDLQGKGFKFRMFPVPTTTGAIRLEDQKAGAVWLQLANKSMLMNQKLGVRMADECASPAQMAVAEAIKLNPPVSVLDAPKPVPTPAPEASPPPVAASVPAATPTVPTAGATTTK